MNTTPETSFFSPKQASFWVGLFFISALFLSLSLIVDMSPLIAPGIFVVLASFAFLKRPLVLLGILITIRMTLDYLSETIHISIGSNVSMSLSQALGVFLILLSVTIFALYIKKMLRFPLWKPFALLGLFGLVSATYSVDPLQSIEEIARLVSIFSISFLAFISVTDTTKMKQVLLILLFSSILPVMESVRQVALNIGLTDSSVDVPRIYGTFAHTNVLALYLFSLFAIMTFYFFLPPSKNDTGSTKRSALLPFVLICYGFIVVLLLLLTYTRVAWVALFLYVLILALWRSRIFLFPLIAIPAILFVFSPTIHDRILESFQTKPDSSIVWRQEIWHDVTTKLRIDGRRLYGTGLDTFSSYAYSLRGTNLGSTDSHNDFVKFYVEGGVIGLAVFLLYLTLIGSQIRTLWTLPLAYRRLVVAFSLYGGLLLLSSLTDNIYKDTPLQWIFFILLGALIAFRQLPEFKHTSAR